MINPNVYNYGHKKLRESRTCYEAGIPQLFTHECMYVSETRRNETQHF